MNVPRAVNEMNSAVLSRVFCKCCLDPAGWWYCSVLVYPYLTVFFPRASIRHGVGMVNLSYSCQKLFFFEFW